MTSKLKCPFCGQELGGNMAEPCCRNQNCEMNAIPIPRTIWEKLTQATQDLEQSERCCSAWKIQALDYKDGTIALSGKLEIATKALEDIATNDYDSDWQNDIAQSALEIIKETK